MSETQSQKLWGGGGLHPLVEAYTVGDDYVMDMSLLPYDIEASIAHAKMLHKIYIITKEDLDAALLGLNQILNLWKEGKFVISPSQEDGHTAIEQYLTINYGDVGKKIHTGRSRNDQSLVMIRLFAKSNLTKILDQVNQLAEAFHTASSTYIDTPMPGYTHTQKAMPTTVGRWLEQFRVALLDSRIVIEATLKLIDQNPLGSAAGFGINHLELDREMTTRLLGFEKVQQNPMYCGFSRGYFENIVLQALSQVVIVCSRFACDMIMFTQQELAFFSLPDNFVTGSSIMPQKKNYDLFEIMRANGRVFASYQFQIQEIIMSLGSGYHRDLQLTKKPFLNGIRIVSDTVTLLTTILPSLQVHKEALSTAMSKHLFATDAVYKEVVNGTPFREAYLKVKQQFFETE